jgi:hypothetical protein
MQPLPGKSFMTFAFRLSFQQNNRTTCQGVGTGHGTTSRSSTHHDNLGLFTHEFEFSFSSTYLWKTKQKG